MYIIIIIIRLVYDYEYQYYHLCHLTFSGYYFFKKSSAYMLLVMPSQDGLCQIKHCFFYFELELVLVLIKNLRSAYSCSRL